MPKKSTKDYQPRSDLLAGRNILVTGAGDGIGKVAAQYYASLGAQLILLGRTSSKLAQVDELIHQISGERSLIIPVDLEQFTEDTAIDLTKGLTEQYHCIDGLLHNASILGPKVPIESYEYSEWTKVMHINFNAQLLITQALLTLLSQSKDASVIFTSSGVGRRGRAYWGAYAVSKFATEGLMEVLGDELENTSNIRVNSLNPGATRTQMRAAAFPAEDPQTLPTPDQHMPLYAFLMGPDSKGITKQRFDAATWRPDEYLSRPF